MSVSVTQYMQKVGTFEFPEFIEFFKKAFFDVVEVYNIISSIMTGRPHSLNEEINEEVDHICENLFLFLLGYHKQYNWANYYKLIFFESVQKGSIVVDKFIEEKLNMNHCIHSYFFDSKLRVNLARAEIVKADKQTAINQEMIIRSFVKTTYGYKSMFGDKLRFKINLIEIWH